MAKRIATKTSSNAGGRGASNGRGYPKELVKSHLETLEDSARLGVDLLVREKGRSGPENPITLKQLIEDKKQYMISSVRFLKENVDWKDDADMLSRSLELVEKFTPDSLSEAGKIFAGLKGRR